MKWFLALWLVLPGSALMAAPARPGDEPPRTGSIADLKKLSLEELLAVEVATVTTPSKRPERTTAAPATVIVIDRNEIELRGYRTLKDLLRDLPGMETVEFSFSEYGTLVPVRGIVGNNKIVVLVNGMRVNPPGGENLPLRTDFSVRGAQQIEVMYGPGSTLYGQDAISAVINVKTYRPDAPLIGTVAADGGLNYERDAWGTFGSAWGPDKRYRFFGHAYYHDSTLTQFDEEYAHWWDGYRQVSLNASPGGLGLTPERKDFGLNFFGRFEVDDLLSLQVWHRQSERSSSEGFSPILGYLKEAIWGDQSTVVEGRHTWAIRDNVKLESALTYNRYAIDPDSRYVFWTVSGGATNWFFNDFKTGRGESWSVEETVRWELHPRLSILVGMTAQFYDITPKYTAGGAGFTYYTTISNLATAVAIPGKVRTRYETYAGYVEGTWQMLDRLKAIAGVRVTKDTRYDDVPVTPRAALVYDVTDEWTAKYVFSRAFVAPAPYFASSTYDNGSRLATTNPDLEPETATTHEFSLEFHRPNFTAGATAYYGEQENLILLSDSGAAQNTLGTVWVGTNADEERTLVRSANGGRSTRYGVDLYAHAKLGPFSPWASYSYVDFEQENNGVCTGLPGISRHNARAGVTWAVTPKLFVTPSFVLRSTPENLHAGALRDEVQTPWDVNLHVFYNASRHLDLFLNIRNAFNHHYALRGITGSTSATDAIPQETFGITAGLRWVF
jgi:outer membrane receptor protein involved in Fe transport